MARSDLLLDLVGAGTRGDQALFRRVVEALIAEERAKQHHVLADHLHAQLQSNASRNGANGVQKPIARNESELFSFRSPRLRLSDLILSPEVSSAVSELIEENQRRELLFSYNLLPRHRILLIGPPGNGKTSIAEAIASELSLPLYTVRYDRLVGSFLGETAQRLSTLFSEVRTQPCVLFFDEADAVAKERGDEHETGEIKRVVSSLLLEIDSLPSHTVFIAATNHPELLDRAAWRRFEVYLELLPPIIGQKKDWWDRFRASTGLKFEHSFQKVSMRIKGASFSDLDRLAREVYRRYVLDLPNSQPDRILENCLKKFRPSNRRMDGG